MINIEKTVLKNNIQDTVTNYYTFDNTRKDGVLKPFCYDMVEVKSMFDTTGAFVEVFSKTIFSEDQAALNVKKIALQAQIDVIDMKLASIEEFNDRVA